MPFFTSLAWRNFIENPGKNASVSSKKTGKIIVNDGKIHSFRKKTHGKIYRNDVLTHLVVNYCKTGTTQLDKHLVVKVEFLPDVDYTKYKNFEGF